MERLVIWLVGIATVLFLIPWLLAKVTVGDLVVVAVVAGAAWWGRRLRRHDG